ncbi:sulfotransferase family protein [Aureitalea marina]|uniref:Sulfotransferase domain-containing protein n=1 Tax=Aureitalea marina TaxID=930804 RepID=A0A2S7KNU8_9FLAO|nr:sulfotransferase [Aureitalea marina]PQB04243.1 hypothetical protein BST85_04485 [Aureitalea marina]
MKKNKRDNQIREGMKPTVVILLSDKRSGSTMLQDALCAHSQIQTVRYSPHTYLETQHWLKGAVILEKDQSDFHGNKVYSGYGSAKNARIYLKDELNGNLPDFNLTTDDSSLVFSGWEAICEEFAKPVFFEKSPQVVAHWGALALILEWMQITKFRVKIIGLVRNPLAVQYSAFKLFRSLPVKRQFGWLSGQKNLVRFAQAIDPASYYQLRYEDLVNQPEKSLQAICDFIGCDFEEATSKNIHGNSMRKWNDDPFFDLQLDPSVVNMAMELGYSADELANNNESRPDLLSKLKWQLETAMIKSKNKIMNRWIHPLRLFLRLNRDRS